jgi:hypothetical protein
MAQKKMTAREAAALAAAGKYFGDPKQGKARIAKFQTDMANRSQRRTANAGPNKPAMVSKAKNLGSPSDAAARMKPNNPGSPSDAAARAIAARPKPKNPGSPSDAAARKLKGGTKRPGRGAR